MLIPNRVLLFFFPTALAARLIFPTSPWWDAYAGVAVGFLLLLVVAIVSKGGMGGGDIKLFAVLGLFVGVKGIFLTFILASLFGAIAGALLLLLKKTSRKEPIPFAPFIGMAALISFVYGDAIWASYMKLLT